LSYYAERIGTLKGIEREMKEEKVREGGNERGRE